MNTVIGLLIAVVVSLTSSGCGKAPDLNVNTSPVATTPTVAAVTQSFAYTQGQQACAALKTWDSSKTNIQFVNDPSGHTVWLFTAAAISQNGTAYTQAISITISVSGTQYCSMIVENGKIVSIQ